MVFFGLYAGMELSGERLEELHAAAALAELKERAVGALSLRPLSRRELVRKLTARPRPARDGKEKPAADPAAAEAVADWLEELGYLNDAEYAKSVVRHYSAKGYGERKLRDELYRRGVPRDCWEEALSGVQDPENEIDRFIRRKMRGRTPGTPGPSSAPPTPWPAGATGGRRSRRGWSATARRERTKTSFRRASSWNRAPKQSPARKISGTTQRLY